MKDSIRKSDFVVPNIHDIDMPTIGKEASYYDVLCKEAGITSGLGAHIPGIAMVGTLGLGTINAINSGEGLTPAYMGAAALAPFAGLNAKWGRNIYKKISAGRNAEKYLTEGLSAAQIEAGGNKLKGLRQNISGAGRVVADDKRYQSLAQKVNGGGQMTQKEIDTYAQLHSTRNQQAFNTKYRQGDRYSDMLNSGDLGGLAQKLKGNAIKGLGFVNENVRNDMVAGQFANQGHIQPFINQNKSLIESSRDLSKNLNYMKNQNIDPQKVIGKLYEKGGHPENFIGTSHNEFKNSAEVQKNNPNSPASKPGIFSRVFGGNEQPSKYQKPKYGV